MKPTAEAYQLMHDGATALAQVEANGMRVDVDYLDKSITRCDQKIEQLTDEIKQDDVFDAWKNKFKHETNLGSRPQLATILFDELGHPCERRTKTGRPGCAVTDLEKVDLPFVRKYLQIAKLEKMQSTYLKGIRNHVADGFLHPSFNIHLVDTYRSSCDSPNLQNIPRRNPKIGKLVRQAFIPRDGHVLVEIDYSSAEVRCAACYGKDPTMLRYIEDNYDMHKDMADECYLLDGNVSKEARDTAKNKFVFPELYGNWYAQVASDMWNDLHKYQLKDSLGAPIKEHLFDKGIYELGDSESGRDEYFTTHIKEVEDRFWNERFPVHNEWREEWWDSYLKNACFRMLTGFVIRGIHKRTEVFNYCIQGVAFHWLLWSLIQLVNEIRLSKMGAKVVCEIHDSVVADVPKNELDDYVGLARDIMTKRIRQHWEWIITPLEIEAEVAEDNWWNKKEYAIG